MPPEDRSPVENGSDSAAPRKLRMQYAGGMIRHLGLQMYGGAVPAIAELIANSWDADATRVDVTIPLNTPITGGLRIEVLDDGEGMSFREVNEAYLVVGLDRRRAGRHKSRGGRRVMGRKGIGKLAGFGIAKNVRVETKKNGHLTIFEMDFAAMTAANEYVDPYEPVVVHDGPDRDGVIPYSSGTRVVLTNLEIRNAISADRFQISMSRRFSTLSAAFVVRVNGRELVREELPLDFRFPQSGLTVEHVSGLGTVEWWMGFTRKPIPQEEARGIVVLVRGKLAQAPFFFDQTRGTAGQLGLQYMTGEVHADDIDDVEDLISTDRASIRWEHERAQSLLAWGQAKVRESLQEWARLRRQRNEGRAEGRLRDRIPHIDRIRQFPDTQQRELLAAVEQLASVETIEDARLDALVDFLLNAYENQHLLTLMRQISEADPDSLAKLTEVVEEWDILEAVSVAQVVRGRIAMIDKFRNLIDERAREVPDMHDFIEKHPWALRPEWAPLARERSLERALAEYINPSRGSRRATEEGRRRIDAMCLASPGIVVVVELKRPGELVGREELRQLEDYVDFFRGEQAGVTAPGERRQVIGFFVYGRMRPGSEELIARLTNSGIFIEPWEKLWQDAERLHRDYLDVMRSRADSEDSRIVGLDALDAALGTPAAGA